jgi:hypothetical protein
VIKHIVTFAWKDWVSEADVAAITEQLRQLPAGIEAIHQYSFGSDLGLTDGTGDFAIIATVTDATALRTYLEHPLHVPAAQRLREMAERRLAVQIQEP